MTLLQVLRRRFLHTFDVVVEFGLRTYISFPRGY